MQPQVIQGEPEKCFQSRKFMAQRVRNKALSGAITTTTIQLIEMSVTRGSLCSEAMEQLD